jgi:pyrroline-5-carboxylate reductase
MCVFTHTLGLGSNGPKHDPMHGPMHDPMPATPFFQRHQDPGLHQFSTMNSTPTTPGTIDHTPLPGAGALANALNATIAFVGGGNMASAILGGLLKNGFQAHNLHVIEPLAAQREQLRPWGVHTWEAPEAFLSHADLVIWAVKPQVFKTAAQSVSAWTHHALHLSVAAGITMQSMSEWLQAPRLVRAMPNTPALVGLGQTGLFANSNVSASDKTLIEAVLHSTGQWLWLQDETLLDAVTAISGSGPAYVFYFLEAMCQAGEHMGLSSEEAKQLAIGTMIGAGNLASQSAEPASVLRERVTSKGGTTQAALDVMNQAGLGEKFKEAMWAANHRAKALGAEYGS